MIQFFIRIANNWVGKVIFGLLLFGMLFVLGYGGLNATSRYAGHAVKVGDTTLSLKQLDDALRQEQQTLSRLTGQSISLKQAIEMGLLDNVIRQKTNEMILNSIKAELGLTASNNAVRKYIEQNPAFADVNGRFDRNLFLMYVRRSGMTERAFYHKLQDELATQHLTRTLHTLAYAPTDLISMANRYRNETRNITAVVVAAEKLPIASKPTEQELQDYYDAYAEEMFVTPEYRRFNYVRLTPTMLTSRVVVSPDEVEQVFAERKEGYATPEKRLISQMFFADEAAAQKLLPDVTADNFDTVAKSQLGQADDITNFGYVAATELSEALSEAAFAASVGQVIGPIQGATGYHLLLVKDIQAGQTPSDASIRDQIKKQLAGEKVYAVYDDLVRRLEEELAEGKTLEEAAKTLSFSVGNSEPVDVSGKCADGQDLSTHLSNRDLLQNLFTLKVGEVTPIFDNEDGILVAELVEIIPVGLKSVQAVRPELEKLWLADQRKNRLQTTLDQFKETITNQSAFDALVVSGTYPVVREVALTRNGSEQLPPAVVQDIFKQKTGGDHATVIQADTDGYLVVVNQVAYPDLDKDALDQIKASVLEETGNELSAGVVAAYADKVGVDINQAEIQKAFSAYLTNRD